MTAIDTYTLLRAFCDELARCGLQHACTSPGSRCAPLALSLVREPRIRCWSHIDERCAGFFALGAAKFSGAPVALTCTSGTAAANFAPAVIEAFQARVPLIVLTADRPPELRDVGAGQTIDQLKLYGSAVKWFMELDLHQANDEAMRRIRTLACRAYWTALEDPQGPVHLNVPLREPLVLEDPLPGDATGRDDGRPYVRFQKGSYEPSFEGSHPAERTVLVAGSGIERADAAALAELATTAQIPLLADPLSGARRGEAAIAYYDLLLRDRRFADEHRPRFVLRFGDLPTSKPLREWLASLHDVAQIAIGPQPIWQDPHGVLGMQVVTAIRSLMAARSEEQRPERDAWFQSWRGADEVASATIEQTLGDSLSEPLVARSLGRWLPPESALFVASSMPVRDLESFLCARADSPRVLANRGANGIDGTVSAAFGAAAASDQPVVLLTGDVALAHDLGGLLAARRLGLALTIVLLNNDGGGIFHFLPISRQADAFERHVATPHKLDFSAAAALYGLRHERPSSTEQLRGAIERAIAGDSATIVEVRTDRQQNLDLHRRIEAAVGDALSRPAAAGSRRA